MSLWTGLPRSTVHRGCTHSRATVISPHCLLLWNFLFFPADLSEPNSTSLASSSISESMDRLAEWSAFSSGLQGPLSLGKSSSTKQSPEECTVQPFLACFSLLNIQFQPCQQFLAESRITIRCIKYSKGLLRKGKIIGEYLQSTNACCTQVERYLLNAQLLSCCRRILIVFNGQHFRLKMIAHSSS